jgi:hypothetical protein
MGHFTQPGILLPKPWLLEKTQVLCLHSHLLFRMQPEGEKGYSEWRCMELMFVARHIDGMAVGEIYRAGDCDLVDVVLKGQLLG